MAPAERSGAPSGAALVLYGERSTEHPRGGCPDAIEGLRLAVKDVDGPRYLQLRCQRRSCRYCGWLRDLEDATCLFLDAREQQPALAITLTTREPWHLLDPGVYRRASSQLWRALRARYGRVEYVGLVEFTTGLSERSGGERRMHGHYLVKGIDPGEVLAVEAIVREVWERCTGAYVVEVSELRSAGGAIAYMGLHHRKPEQAAPEGWRGMRLRASQRYWQEPIGGLRERARRHMAIRTRTWLLEQEGVNRELAAAMAELEIDVQRQAVEDNGVELVRVRERDGGVVEPLGPVDPRGAESRVEPQEGPCVVPGWLLAGAAGQEREARSPWPVTVVGQAGGAAASGHTSRAAPPHGARAPHPPPLTLQSEQLATFP